MSKIVIIADSTCDLSEELQREYDIVSIPGHINLPNHPDVQLKSNWELFSKEEFYDDLKKNPGGYSTSPANVSDFSKYMQKYAAEGCDLIVATISSGISGAYGFACIAKKEVREVYPEAKIECIDSMKFGPGFGLMLIYASMMRNQGSSFEEIVHFLNDNKGRFHQAGWLDDLSFVAKKGRMSHSKAFLGSLVGIKPIGEFDYNGLTTVIGKVKGTKAAYQTLLNYIENTIEKPEEQIIIIAETNRRKQAEEYKVLIEEKFHPKKVMICDIYPDCGVNIGPGLMAAYYYGKEISEDLSFEKNIINNYLESGAGQ